MLNGCWKSYIATTYKIALPLPNIYYPMYLEVCKSREAGKSITYIVENILKMGGHKFSEDTAGHSDTKF